MDNIWCFSDNFRRLSSEEQQLTDNECVDPRLLFQDEFNRRTFLKRTGGVGLAALAGLFAGEGWAAGDKDPKKRFGGLTGIPHFKPKANRVIYLHQSGAPSQF